MDCRGSFPSKQFILAAAPESLLQLIASEPLHGVIFHSDILTPAQIVSIAEIRAFTAYLPTIGLADQWELDVARNCGQIGIDTVLACGEKQEKKIAAISSALRTGGFRKLLSEAGRSHKGWPVQMKNVYELIFSNFPKMLQLSKLSAALGIHRRNFEKEFRKIFGLSYVHFVRVRRMYESWHLMQYTDLNNSKIAAYLGYYKAPAKAS